MTPRSGTVPVPRGVLAALVAALALAVLLAVFLLGRHSAPVASIASPEGAAPATAPALPPEERTAPPPPRSETVPEIVPAPLPAPSTLFEPASAAAATPETGGREREEVARYFQESEAIQARAKYWSDPQALAKTLLEQAASGNASGFDELIRAQKTARNDLERLTVPPAGAEHHRRSLAVLGEGLALLERVQAAVSSGELTGLEPLTEKGRDLEREARDIDELGRRIRQRFGV